MHVYKGDRARVEVGNHVAIEPGVDFLVGGNHRLDWITIYPLREMYELPGAYVGNPWSRGDIVVGHGVWIGRGARILSGVTIGEGSIVAPFSVVTRDVRPYAVVTGHPAVELGRRFPDSVVESLANIDWVAWPAERIEDELDRLTGAESRLPSSRARASGSHPEAVHEVDKRASPRLRRVRRFVGRGLRALLGAVDPSAPSSFPTPVDEHSSAERVTMGRASYQVPVVRSGENSEARVVVGNYSSIAPECEVLLDTGDAVGPGPARAVATSGSKEAAGRSSRADVVIGSDVWIGTGVKILPGITIGDGAVIAAWSVVANDVAPFAIVAGNPAREIRIRFDPKTVEALLRIRWWDWPDEEVLARWQELCSPDITSFVARHDPHPSRPSSPTSGDVPGDPALDR